MSDDAAVSAQLSIEDWRLLYIVLNECAAARHGGDGTKQGDVTGTNLDVTATWNGEHLAFIVGTTVEVPDEDGDLIAKFAASFALGYDIGSKEPSAQQVSQYAPSAILQAVPFLREMISTLTSRMGLQVILHPLMNANDLMVETHEVAGDAGSVS